MHACCHCSAEARAVASADLRPSSSLAWASLATASTSRSLSRSSSNRRRAIVEAAAAGLLLASCAADGCCGEALPGASCLRFVSEPRLRSEPCRRRRRGGVGSVASPCCCQLRSGSTSSSRVARPPPLCCLPSSAAPVRPVEAFPNVAPGPRPHDTPPFL